MPLIVLGPNQKRNQILLFIRKLGFTHSNYYNYLLILLIDFIIIYNATVLILIIQAENNLVFVTFPYTIVVLFNILTPVQYHTSLRISDLATHTLYSCRATMYHLLDLLNPGMYFGQISYNQQNLVALFLFQVQRKTYNNTLCPSPICLLLDTLNIGVDCFHCRLGVPSQIPFCHICCRWTIIREFKLTS